MFPVRERAGEVALTKFFVDRRIHTVSVCSLTWLARLHIATHSLYVAEQELGGPGEPAGDGAPAGAAQLLLLLLRLMLLLTSIVCCRYLAGAKAATVHGWIVDSYLIAHNDSVSSTVLFVVDYAL